MRYCLPFELRHGVMVESKQKLVLVGSATQTEGESNFVEMTDEAKRLLHGSNGEFINDGAEYL